MGGVRPGWYSGAALAGRDLVSDRRETGQSELFPLGTSQWVELCLCTGTLPAPGL